MDKLTYYRHTIQTLLSYYYNLNQHQNPENPICDRLALDPERDQYLWLRIGWDGKKRVQHIILYLQIQNGKIWIEEDSTNFCIVDDLLNADIPKQDIILGFQHPSKRHLTEFATHSETEVLLIR
ncbi:XisI protein [Pseudanabaena galeata UHCC 0370]|uniref:XisI protein n=1 Tax=Pseudanabaena galeata UHCC 0370 TaxID=3110310 RepID=A0ABU5TL68_9CYAN|nr:XisI protein [Pseudanabaena galeata]MEA5479080.1 XisI protein [Pseudanabaena galeata UHCC 0370]